MEHFISKIQFKKLRHLENIDIILSDNQRKRMVDLTPFFQRKIFRVP